MDLKPALTPRPLVELPPDEILSRGHLACPGCGAAIAMRMAIKVLGRRVVIVCPACCWAVIDGPFPYSAAGVAFLHCAFETAASTAAGVRAGLDARGVRDVLVLAWAGDGGTFDIGLQALSACAERNEDFLYVCYDNEAYMNTGIQRSSATPLNAWTTTTPRAALKSQPKKDIDAILAAHRVPYQATASPAFPEDYVAKFRRAAVTRGFRFIHVLAPCTPGWKYEERLTIELSRLAVRSRVFPLYEIHAGGPPKITVPSDGLPVRDYLCHQGRFSGLSDEEIGEIQTEVDLRWERLVARRPQ